MLRPIVTDLADTFALRTLKKAELISDVSWDHVISLFQDEPTDSDDLIPTWFEPPTPMAEFFNFCRVVHNFETIDEEYPADFCDRVPGLKLGVFLPLLTQRLDIHPTKLIDETINVVYFVQYVSSIITHCYNVLSRQRLTPMTSACIPHRKEFRIGDIVTSLVDGYMRIPLSIQDIDTDTIVFIVEAKRSPKGFEQLQYQITTELSSLIYDRRTKLMTVFKTRPGIKKQHLLLVEFSGSQAWFHLASFGPKYVKYLTYKQVVYHSKAKNWLRDGFLFVQRIGPYDITADLLDMVTFAKLCVALYLTASEAVSDASLNLHDLATDYFGTHPS
ncbi:hypothetical protein EV127DRAFT_443347 [Xylaria flabelliformis]|nr:hypothetical protein EV127DRAFT_443347 [Xylaria flabelliformis]